jgi:PKD repeat protein
VDNVHCDIGGVSMSMHIGTAPLIIVFENASGGGEAESYLWDFGDGETSDLMNVTHTFVSAGTYNVVLTATGPGGTASHTETVVVEDPPPNVSFDISDEEGDLPLEVAFYNLSTGVISSHHWVFGDGSTSSEENPGHTFASSGTYATTLTVTGPGGVNSYSRRITVLEPPPHAIWLPSVWGGVTPLLVDFENLTTGLATSYLWDFGDGTTTSTEEEPQHTFTTAGTFSITLTATGPGGSTSLTQQLNPSLPLPPVPDFDFGHNDSWIFHGGNPEGPPPQDVIFNNKTTGEISSYLWDFGDGTSTSTEEHPTHTYTTAGSYNVTLTAIGVGGNVLKVKTVTITPPRPNADFDFTSSPTCPYTAGSSYGPCEAPIVASVTNTSSGDITGYFWQFGDGFVSSDENPAPHTFTDEGTYSISLRVTGPGGTSYAYKEIVIVSAEALPAPNFRINTANFASTSKSKAWSSDGILRTLLNSPAVGKVHPKPNQWIRNAAIDGAEFTSFPGVSSIAFTIQNTTENVESDWTWSWHLRGASGAATRDNTSAKTAPTSFTYNMILGESREYSISLTATNSIGSATKTVTFNLFRRSTPIWQYWTMYATGPQLDRKPHGGDVGFDLSPNGQEGVNRLLDPVYLTGETGVYEPKAPFTVVNSGVPDSECKEKVAAVWCLNNPPKWLVDALKDRGGAEFNKLRLTYLAPSAPDVEANWDELSTGLGNKLYEFSGASLSTVHHVLGENNTVERAVGMNLCFLHQMSATDDAVANGMSLPSKIRVVVVETMTTVVKNFGLKIWLKEGGDNPYGSGYSQNANEKNFKQIYTHSNYHAELCKGMEKPTAMFEIIKSNGQGEHWHITLKNLIKDGKGDLIRNSDEALRNVGGWRWTFSDNDVKPLTSRLNAAHADQYIRPVLYSTSEPDHESYPNKSGLKYTNGPGYTDFAPQWRSGSAATITGTYKNVDHEHSMDDKIAFPNWTSRGKCRDRHIYHNDIRMIGFKNCYKTGIVNGVTTNKGGTNKYWVKLEVWGIGGQAGDAGNSTHYERWQSNSGTSSPYKDSTAPANTLKATKGEIIKFLNKNDYQYRAGTNLADCGYRIDGKIVKKACWCYY